MKKIFLCIAVFVCAVHIGVATTYYVRTDGDDYDGRSGTINSPSGAWRTIEKACREARGGDTVNVVDGIYVEGTVAIYDKIGTKNRPLVIRAMNQFKAVIRSISCCSAVQIRGSTGVVFDGFEVTFDNPANSYLFGIATENSFWVTIKNCYVHDIGSSGIQINDGEYLFVENNIVRDNGKNTGNPNGSGISSFHAKYSPDYQAGDWGIVIRNNICFENVCPFALPGFNSPVDGNGIILDDFRNLQTQFGGGQPGGYYHPVLVENNLIFNNGGRGVHIYHTDNITVRNNTLYHNNFELSKYFGFGWNGDLNIDESTGCKIFNNIVVMRPTNERGYAALVWEGTDVHNNIIIGPEGTRVPPTSQGPVSGLLPIDNLIQPITNQGYVKLVNPIYNVDPFDLLSPKFSRFYGLAAGSPAINGGSNSNRAATDLEGKTRPMGGTVDIGCYESEGLVGGDNQVPTAPTNLTVVSKTVNSVRFSWTASTDNVGVIGYDVYNGSNLFGVVTTTSVTVTGLQPNTDYTFIVRAKDAAGNISPASTALVVRTAADTQAPTVPTNLILTNGQLRSAGIAWTASTDNVGVVGYEVYRDTTRVETTTATSTTIRDLTPNTTYRFTVRAKDAAGNRSAASTALVFTTPVPKPRTNYYVRTDGDDYGQPGTANTPDKAWRTIQWACAHAQEGDTIFVEDGVYVEGGLYIEDKKGTKDKPLVVKAIRPQKVFVRSRSGGSAVEIINSVGVVFDGFDVTFDNPASSYLFGIATNNSFWVTIKNCHVHDIGSSGIQINDGEYIFVENNIVRDNGKNTGNPNGSGISSFHAKYSPDYKEGDWGIVIRNNICFENVCPFALPGYTSPVDGNGIILDDYLNLQTQFGGGQPGGYFHPVLVENNLIFNNGGRGIHIYHTDNVTVRNNTLYHNNFELSKYPGFGWNGDMNIDESKGSKVYNNIVVMRPTNERGYAFLITSQTEAQNNLIVGPEGRYVTSGQAPVSGLLPASNLLQPLANQTYVKFTNATYTVDPFNILNPQFSRFFGLAAGSPAINGGSNSNRASTDLEGKTRPIGGTVDIGCYESGIVDNQPPTIPQNLTLINTTGTTIRFSWTASTDNVGVTGYNVYSGTTLVATTTSTNVVVRGLRVATSYTFTVRAKDASGNVSAASIPFIASTRNPSVGDGLKGEFFTQYGLGVAQATAAISNAIPAFVFTARTLDYPGGYYASSGGNWGPWLGTDGSGAPTESVFTSTLKMTGFIRIEPTNDRLAGNNTIDVDFALGSHGFTGVKINGTQVLIDEVNTAFNTTGRRVNFPAPGYYPIEFIHSVGQYDPSGLEFYSSIGSNINPGRGTGRASTIISPTVLFKERPAESVTARVIATTQNTVTLAWNAASGASAYEVYNGISLVGSTSDTTFRFTGLTANTSYTFSVRSKDAAGNHLGLSAPVSVRTSARVAANGDEITEEAILLQDRIALFPNPAGRGETISIYPGLYAQKEVRMVVMDVTGKQLISRKMNFTSQSAQLSLSLPKGMYMLMLTDGHTSEQTKLVIH